jgi:hypothetical protein
MLERWNPWNKGSPFTCSQSGPSGTSPIWGSGLEVRRRSSKLREYLVSIGSIVLRQLHIQITRYTIVLSLAMRVFSGIALPFLAVASTAYGASWGFEDATLTVQEKGAGINGGAKQK